MIFSTVHAAALSGIEATINGALRYDAGTQKKLQSLDQQVLLIDCVLPPIRIAVESSEDGLRLYDSWTGEAAVTVSGSLVALANLAITNRGSSSLANSGVKVSGSLESLQQFSEVLSTLDIDWEAALADLLGDIPTHIIGETLRKSAQFKEQTLERATSALTEISQEELRLTPSPSEYQQFKQGVRELATDTDRLMAKLNKFLAQINVPGGSN